MKYLMLLTVCALIGFTRGKTFNIFCGKCSDTDLIKSKNIYGDCNVTVISSGVYHDTPDGRGAPVPILNDVSWETYNKTNGDLGISINSKWSLQGNESSITTGFVFSVTGTSNSRNYRQIDVSFSKDIRWELNDTVIINYPCFGKEFDPNIRPDAYLVDVRPLPSFSVSHIQNGQQFAVSKVIYIEGDMFDDDDVLYSWK